MRRQKTNCGALLKSLKYRYWLPSGGMMSFRIIIRYMLDIWMDVILALGTRLSEVTTQDYSLITLDKKLIHIDIDFEKLGKVYAPWLGIVADAKEALKAFGVSQRKTLYGVACVITSQVQLNIFSFGVLAAESHTQRLHVKFFRTHTESMCRYFYR